MSKTAKLCNTSWISPMGNKYCITTSSGDKKAGRLKDEGAFRVPTDRTTWERIDAPKFEGEVLHVTGLKGANVESGDKSFPVKTVLAVPQGSANVDLAAAGPG